MMRHDDPDRRGGSLQPCRRSRELRLIQPAAAVKWERARAIQPDRDHPSTTIFRVVPG